MRKNSSLTALFLLHKAMERGLATVLRGPNSPFRNYYAALSRAGLAHGAQGTSILPRARVALGSISPTLTGLTDYEFGRMLGAGARSLPVVGPSVAPGLVKLAPHAKQLMSYISGSRPSDLQSPLLSNLATGLQKNPQSRVVNYLSRYTSTNPVSLPGTSALLSHATQGAALGAMAGQPVAGAVKGLMSSLPEAALTSSAYSGALNTIAKIKSMVLARGMTPAKTLGGKAIDALFRLPTPSNEVFLAGRDYANMMGAGRRMISSILPAPIRQSATQGMLAGEKELTRHLTRHANVPWGEALEADAVHYLSKLRAGRR